MYALVDSKTNKIVQTINTKYGIEINEDIKIYEITDELFNKFINSYEYELIFEEKEIQYEIPFNDSVKTECKIVKVLKDIRILKTRDEWKKEQSLNPNISEEAVDEEKVAMAEAIVDLNSELEILKEKINKLEKEGK